MACGYAATSCCEYRHPLEEALILFEHSYSIEVCYQFRVVHLLYIDFNYKSLKVFKKNVEICRKCSLYLTLYVFDCPKNHFHFDAKNIRDSWAPKTVLKTIYCRKQNGKTPWHLTSLLSRRIQSRLLGVRLEWGGVLAIMVMPGHLMPFGYLWLWSTTVCRGASRHQTPDTNTLSHVARICAKPKNP